MGTPLSLGINPDIDQGLPQLEAICLQSTSLNQTKPRSKLTWSRDRDDGSMNKSYAPILFQVFMCFDERGSYFSTLLA